MYRDAICPRLLWDFATSDLDVTWLQKKLEPLATHFLKRWTGLAKSANTSRLYLPKSIGGLQLPSLVTTYKKLKCAMAASHTASKDSLVRHIATQKTLAENSNQRSCFTPYQEVIHVMQEDPGSNRKQLMKSVKARISAEDREHRIKHCQSLSIQSQTMRPPINRAPVLWSMTVTKLPEHVFKFALNAITDTLPHNANVHLWKKSPLPTCKLCPDKQTLSHVLNSCSTALNHRRFNLRHDSVLKDLYLCLKHHLPNVSKLNVDLPDTEYTPSHSTLQQLI